MSLSTYSSRCIFNNASRPLRRQQQVNTSELTDASEWLAKIIDIDSCEVCVISHNFTTTTTAGLNTAQISHCQTRATSVQSTTAWTHSQPASYQQNMQTVDLKY